MASTGDRIYVLVVFVVMFLVAVAAFFGISSTTGFGIAGADAFILSNLLKAKSSKIAVYVGYGLFALAVLFWIF